MKQLISVEQALAKVLADARPLPAEKVALHDAAWRVLAADIVALRTQPPFPAAAMDGYAVTDSDALEGAELDLIGESAAGRRFNGKIESGQAVRIFTGAPVPEGADSVIMQEDVERLDGQRIRISREVTPGRHVRVAAESRNGSRRSHFAARSRRWACRSSGAPAAGRCDIGNRR